MARKSKRPASRGSVNNIILEVLSTGKKYGYEIIKEVEEKTNGKIKLKQPSLYSSLSRFEEKNYLSSFWQDSDIGGKRHYYELTPLGIEAYRKLASRGQDDDDDVKSDYSPEAIDENQDLEESESTTNETLFEIDEEDDDENDIFNNSTELKLKNYSNFDVSERLNELLNEATESNKIFEETTPTPSQVESYNEKQTVQNENADLNITDTDITKDESVSETFDSENVEEESNNELEEPSSHNIDDDINIVKQSNPFENQSGEIAENKPDSSETLLNNNLTNSINELDQEIEKIKNEETSLKQKNNEYESAEFQQSLKKIYNDIKNYDASAEDQTNNDMSSVPLSFLEMQRRKASMDILYGNAQNYYYPTDGQNTISQKEEQLNFEEFIKLKQDLNNRRFVYDFSTIYHKKPKPYIIQNLYTNKNSKHIEPTKVKSENNEKKLKYTFDEFGIMKIYNEDSDKNKKRNHIIDNVGYRTGTPYQATLQQQPQRPNEGNAQTKQEPIKQRQEVQLSEEEIERKNKNFNELFNKISEGKMIQPTQTPPKNEDDSNDLKVEYKEIISDNNLEEDNFVDFDNSSKNSYTFHTTLYQEQTQAPATNQTQQNTFSNIKIKTYGEVSSFNEESNKYIAINKLKALLGLSMCFLNIILTTVILLILKSQNLVNNSNSVFYKLSYIFSAILLVISLFPYFINKNKRAEDKFNFNYSIIFSSLTFALAIIVTYAFNTLFGFNFSNFKQFSTSLLIPFVWGLNILVIPVVYKLILKTNIIHK